jgi:hypothetical protein
MKTPQTACPSEFNNTSRTSEFRIDISYAECSEDLAQHLTKLVGRLLGPENIYKKTSLQIRRNLRFYSTVTLFYYHRFTGAPLLQSVGVNCVCSVKAGDVLQLVTVRHTTIKKLPNCFQHISCTNKPVKNKRHRVHISTTRRQACIDDDVKTNVS